jgi:hypothetical protein
MTDRDKLPPVLDTLGHEISQAVDRALGEMTRVQGMGGNEAMSGVLSVLTHILTCVSRDAGIEERDFMETVASYWRHATAESKQHDS